MQRDKDGRAANNMGLCQLGVMTVVAVSVRFRSIRVNYLDIPQPWRQTEKRAKPERDGVKRNRQWRQVNITGKGGCVMKISGLESAVKGADSLIMNGTYVLSQLSSTVLITRQICNPDIL
ncbi:hypothetical protein TNCV_3724851 [Trichonephila clavipes]|nr:hypothetical protein TNCV_3724851 [Trichonephila clavipes]